MIASYKIGDSVKVSSDNECYDSFRDKDLIITHVAIDTDDHPGFDDGVNQALYDLEDANTGESISCSLYDYELEGI